MYLPANWLSLTISNAATIIVDRITVDRITVDSIGESAAREREAREGTVQHTLIDSLYVRSWT